MKPCMFISSRYGALIAGTIDLFLGASGLSLLTLNAEQRHMVLNPYEDEKINYQYVSYDVEGDQFKFLLEYWMPSFALFFLGVVLVIAATTRNTCAVIFSFVISTVLVTGCVAGLASLLLTTSSYMAATPLVLVTVLHIYFHWVITDFSKYAWLPERTEDKKVLVESSTV